MNRIVLIDLSQRDLKQRSEMTARVDRLNALERHGGLSDEQKKDRDALVKLLDSDTSVDPLYQAVASHVARKPWEQLLKEDQLVLKHGLFESQRPEQGGSTTLKVLEAREREIASICGLLQIDSLLDPTQKDFVRRMTLAQGEYVQNKALFDRAFAFFSPRFAVSLGSQIDAGLVSEQSVGCIVPDSTFSSRTGEQAIAAASSTSTPAPPVPGRSDTVAALSGRDTAQVVRRLVADGIGANDKYIENRLDSAFDRATGVVDGAPASTIEIDLPDLEEAVDEEIIKENLYAIQAIYFSYMLEETRIFQVVERIVELFRQGLLPLGRGQSVLPLGRGSVGDYLFNYYKKATERITENERRDLYLRCFGAPGGSAVGLEPNRDFNELWLRFVSAVSSYARQQQVERLLRAGTPLPVSQEEVRKAGRDLGANLSRNGYGIAYFAATDLQQSIAEFRDVLQDNELRSAFGARDMWQVIDLVNVNYLGGARNTHRYRTQSRAGAVIIRWIANNADRLRGVTGSVLAVEQLVNPQVRAVYSSKTPMKDPSDFDLVNACEQWLAVGGVQDPTVEQYAQPIESPTMTSRPIDMPQAAREVLAQVGLPDIGSLTA